MVEMADWASFQRKQRKMANISPATAAIASIAQHLAHAAEAARGLDMVVSEDLRSLLRITGCEAERVRKARRKSSASKKLVSRAARQPSKRVRAAVAKAVPQQGRGRRKGAAVNGAAY
jgi:hypothetical protein